MTPDDDGDPCPHCGGEGYIDDPLSSACGGRWFRYCDCPVGEAASEEDLSARAHKAAQALLFEKEQGMTEAQKLIDIDDILALDLLRYVEKPAGGDRATSSHQSVSIDVDPNYLHNIPFSVNRGIARIEVSASSRKAALMELASELGAYSVYLFDMQAAIEAMAESLPDSQSE